MQRHPTLLAGRMKLITAFAAWFGYVGTRTLQIDLREITNRVGLP